MGQKKLTPKQQLFIREYLVDLNATQAAIRAGYSKKTAYAIGKENLHKPQIKKAITEAIKKRAKKIDISAEYVLEKLKGIADKCTKSKTYDPRAAAKALELIGKHLKLFTDKIEVSGELKTLTDEQIDARLSTLAKS